MRCGDLLHEISNAIHASSRPANEHDTSSVSRRADSAATVARAEIKYMEGNVPLNLFLFSLHSFCSTLIEYQG
ncbi:hypothetical protein PsorP6_016782 [Peronosclerospora sorghi]|uniref:Uncharacterized protein n=1 Tax=Peronosclerospora sorghi TaxID=230839 RepID=A0ACC0WG11_9STRA|nr:hypothetical protein PsorP6_016782 [Peronosclerospora sorghi]